MIPSLCMSFDMAKISRRSLDCFGALVLTVIFHLNQKSLPERELNQRLVGRQPGTGGGSQFGQFVVVDVVALVLCEAKKEHREIAEAIRNQRPITSTAPLALSRHALLEDASAKVRIDEPASCPLARARRSSFIASSTLTQCSMYVLTLHWLSSLAARARRRGMRMTRLSDVQGPYAREGLDIPDYSQGKSP